MHFIAFQTIDFPRKTIQNTNHFWEINSLIETIGGKNEPKGARVVLYFISIFHLSITQFKSSLHAKYFKPQLKMYSAILVLYPIDTKA